MGIERRMRLGEGPGSQVLLLCDGVGDRRDHGLVVLQGIEVVLVHQSGLAVADNGDDDGVEDDGHQTPEKPLLYRFIPATGVPVYSTTEE